MKLRQVATSLFVERWEDGLEYQSEQETTATPVWKKEAVRQRMRFCYKEQEKVDVTLWSFGSREKIYGMIQYLWSEVNGRHEHKAPIGSLGFPLEF